MIFYDTEGCGLHGPTILIQYAEDDDSVNLHSVWTEPIIETVELIEWMMSHSGGVIGFNLSFDHFHFCQLYTTIQEVLKTGVSIGSKLQDYIEVYALAEPAARGGVCLKPQKALDLMLHARKGPYQSTMGRKDIKIKRVPTELAWELVRELDTLIPLADIYFQRRQNKTIRWQVIDILDDLQNLIPDFKDIILKFAPSSALKALAVDAGVAKDKRLFWKDIELNKVWRPNENGWAPFALSVGTPGKWNWSWPEVIHRHISHWAYNSLAREYAEDDVKDTRGLYEYFGRPDLDDDDSVLACMVGAVRWRGFAIDTEQILALRHRAADVEQSVRRKFNYNSPSVCRKYIQEVLGNAEKSVLEIDGKLTTKGVILEEIAEWRESIVCEKCDGMGCHDCDDGLIQSDVPHPAAVRAREILDARHAKKEIENYDKLLVAGRFHADFIVIGARSSRMAGAGGLNPQGIKKAKKVRACFRLSDPGFVLSGGDFDGFEVCLADAAYGDPTLRRDLQSGKKIHGLFGTFLFPPNTYEEIIATNGAFNFHDDLYGRSKNGVFALLYGGEAFTLSTRVGIPEDVADRAYREWCGRYKVWGKEREKIFNLFCSMRQPGGIGTKVEWHEPSDYIESMLGFRRYFTLENKIAKALFNLASNPPERWTKLHIKTVRRDRIQTVSGALRSALFAAAFAQQAANMRAAANHVIQSTGAQITKHTQRRIWDVQPSGINHWRVQPMNVHDEVMCPVHPDFVDQVADIVKETVESFREKIPLISISWERELESWAAK